MKSAYPNYNNTTFQKVKKGFSDKNQKIIDNFLKYCGITACESSLKKIHSKIIQIADVLDKSLLEINLTDIREFLRLLNFSGRATETQNDLKKTLKRFLRWQYKDWSERFDGFKDVKTKNGENHKKINSSTLLTDDEIKKLIRASIFDLFTWWGLFHEIGHSSYRVIYEQYSREAIKTIKENRNKYDEGKLSKKKYDEFVKSTMENQAEEYISLAMEVYCDLFAINYAFNGDHERYLCLLWYHNYRLNGIKIFQSSEDLENMFIRSFLVFLYCDQLENLSGRKYYKINFTSDRCFNVRYNEKEIRKGIIRHKEFLLEIFNEEIVRADIDKNINENILSEYISRKKIRNTFKSVIALMAWNKKLPDIVNFKKYDKIYKYLCEGKIMRNIKQIQMRDIIFSMIYGKTQNPEQYSKNKFKINIAALLNIWDIATIKNGEEKR